MTFLITYRINVGVEKIMRVKNCKDKKHAESKFREYAQRKVGGYVAVMNVAPENRVFDTFRDIFNGKL